MSNFQEQERSILHETYVFSEWKPEPEYVQKPDNILPENISVLWRWLKFFGPKKSLIDNITAYKQRKQKWHIALGDEGKVIAVLTDNILEIRTKRSEYATIAARTTVSRDGYCQWRKLVWSPDCSFLVLAYGNGIVSFFDLTASNLFNIPTDCSRPGGLECTDNTHAVAEIIFMPLRVKDNKWNWEVLIITYDGKLRGFLISHTDGFKLHHTFSFVGGVGAVTYSPEHNLLYIAGVPRTYSKDKTSSLYAGLTAWRILNDDPFYKLSVVSDELEAQLANEHFHLYIPFVSGKNLEIILSRFSGAVSVCNVEYMVNILGKKPEFLQGAPQVTGAHDGSFMTLECESNVLPAKKSNSDDSMEVVPVESEAEDTYFDISKELIKSVLYTITDIEHFQPKPKKITIVSRIYRLLGIKSTTSNELFSRKIESGNYTEALNLASEFKLDSDLVYQQQWRKTPVSSEAIQKFLAILKCEKSTYMKDEYDRLRSNSIAHSSIEIAKEGRIDALTCLWPHIKTVSLQMTVLQNIPETINPLEYKHLLPFSTEVDVDRWPPQLLEQENDWCKKEIFRSIWSSNWSEDSTPDNESLNMTCTLDDISKWYNKRAREIEERSGIVSHALTLIILASEHEIKGLDAIMFHLLTLDTLMYDTNLEDVTLTDVEKKSTLETCTLLMNRTSPETFVSDLKQFVVPFLKRYEKFSNRSESCLVGLTEYMESLSINDLSSILLVMQSPNEFELDVRTHLDLVEKCLYAYTGTDQLDKACDLLDTILHESDGSISPNELLRRLKELEKLLNTCNILSCHDVNVTFSDLKNMHTEPKQAQMLLTRVARNMATRDEKPSQQDWEALLKDILDLQSLMFDCVSKELCYVIYASSLLTSGDENTIKLAAEVLICDSESRRGVQSVPYAQSIELVLAASKEYFNSASSLTDPALNLARCCLTLIKDGNKEIEDELDLIASLQILNSFGVSVLPIQVRLCEDRMELIDKCLELDTNAYLASHKLLKLAQLLKISRDDEQKR
ncbi:Neuroblastoma-amplified sequence [Eumeta japonica]|uniref:Neuroblastoma-amplified sequence n=1 Tax=Eumeta variegata TaxID=151549 RepID=A0A4C1W0K4_EUMVA|nr:Neuroblastoma-amplified sequence [Eumeta japonica]